MVVFILCDDYKIIILEYLLVRYAGFLKYSISENEIVDIKDIKDYIVAFQELLVITLKQL